MNPNIFDIRPARCEWRLFGFIPIKWIDVNRTDISNGDELRFDFAKSLIYKQNAQLAKQCALLLPQNSSRKICDFSGEINTENFRITIDKSKGAFLPSVIYKIYDQIGNKLCECVHRMEANLRFEKICELAYTADMLDWKVSCVLHQGDNKFIELCEIVGSVFLHVMAASSSHATS